MKRSESTHGSPPCDICGQPIGACGERVKMCIIDPMTHRLIKFTMYIDDGYICPECVFACSITLGERVP